MKGDRAIFKLVVTSETDARLGREGHEWEEGTKEKGEDVRTVPNPI